MSDARGMALGSPPAIPDDLRTRLEAARLDLLALFRALDRMDLSADQIPQRFLRQFFELDADYAEALWALDQPDGSLDRHAMLRDRLAALDQLPPAAARFRKKLPPRCQPILTQLEQNVRRASTPERPTAWCPAEIPKTFKHLTGQSTESRTPQEAVESAILFQVRVSQGGRGTPLRSDLGGSRPEQSPHCLRFS
jgi:hypothetical protein